MKISEITIQDLRIIRRLSLRPSTGINVVSGANGAGKTSVLEAIYLAGRGRSFRHSEARPLVRLGAKESVVVLKLRDCNGERESTLGVSRGIQDFRCRLNGVELVRRSELAAALPVQWIGSQPQLLLEAGPDVRRRFLDLAVFHVEPNYAKILASYQKALKQRNSALRNRGDPTGVRVWDRPLAEAAGHIDRNRRVAVDAIFDRLAHILDEWQFGFTVEYRYRPGWSKGRGLLEDLSAHVDDDLQRGYTPRGAHRAELEVLCNTGLAQKVLSRGQQKMLVIALQLAVFDLIAGTAAERAPIVMLDDLAAELDYANRSKVFTALDARDGQFFVTRLTDDRLPEPTGAAVFHVEHGELV